MKTLYTLLLASILVGCNSTPKVPAEPRVKVVTEAVPEAIYQPPTPAPLKLENIRWFVITDGTLAEKKAEIERLSANGFVVFAITPKDYENLAGNFQELKRYIDEQRAIIVYYQSVTKTDDSWLEKNDKKREEQRKLFESRTSNP